ncbi:MAG TPA: hypothetical protein VJ768_06295 [Anaerolineales bacterium]|nr:hypothetical protein [Anaerolineales bacterium]
MVLSSAGWDPLALARLGTRFSQSEAGGSEGYDGQFVYYIARELNPSSVSQYLDVPSYRYQRILLPLLARAAALGDPEWIPWTIPVVSLIAHGVGTWLVGLLILGAGLGARYALVYGLWAGFTLAIRLDLPEPLAFALIAGAIYCDRKGWRALSWICYGLALFAKEVTAIFLAAQILENLRRRDWRSAAGLAGVGLLPYIVFQGWLAEVFGAPGIGSGGANSTPFELLPFLGFLRIAAADLRVFLVFLLVFGPFILAPAVWGIWVGIKEIRARTIELPTLFLAGNAAVILFLPFSTYREPGGLLRFSCGLVLAFLLYCSLRGHRRLLNYSFFSLALNVFLIE